MKRILSLFFLILILGACNSSSDTPDGPTDNFDRAAILSNAADNIIIPAFKNLDAKLSILKEKSTAFTGTPDTNSLEEIRTAWYEAYKAWQHVAVFNIGKAEELQFAFYFNTYPVTVADVLANIDSGSYDLNSSNNHDAQGLPALDYLLHGSGADDTEILENFTTNVKAANYKKYLNDLIEKMASINTTILNDWESSYRDQFVQSTGNSATSSLNKLTNDFVFYYEKRLRALKIGIPAGNFSSTPLPTKVEAFYKKTVSKNLVLEALASFKNFFNGNHFDSAASGTGFHSYLIELDKQDLVNSINAQLDAAKDQINSLDANFYDQITTNNTEMTKAYDELQKVVRMLKVDMVQAFSMDIDYVDADGD